MEEIGVVSRVEGISAIVSVPKKGACEHCTAGVCNISDERASIEAINEAKAQPGQRVKVRIKPLAYVKGSMLFYGIPALALIAGAVMGREVFAARFTGADPDAIAAISAFAFLGLSFVAVHLLTRKAEKSVKYQPVIVEILDD